MAIKQVKDYYKKVEKMYLDLSSELKELQEGMKNGDVTQEEVDRLLTPVQGIKDNYLRLSYILHLLYQPQRKEKESKFEKWHKDRVDFFKETGITEEQELKKEEDSLKIFDENIKKLNIKEKKNG